MAQNGKNGISYNDYNVKYRLPEQERDERLLMKHKHHILCYEPGKGKSYPVIHCMQEINKLKNGKASVLIMSDATCIKQMWKTDILPQGLLPNDTYFVTDRTAIGDVKEALIRKHWDLIIVDECQSLRSGVTRAKSQYAKLVYQLSRATEYVFGMTGTISGNNDMEPFCVMHALCVSGMGNIKCNAFKNNYCIKELQYGPFGAFEKPVRLNYKGQELMKIAYEEGCSFWDYNDGDEMPPMTITIKTFEVEKTEAYTNALDGIIKCGENESTVMKAIALQKAQQVLNGFIYYDDQSVRKRFEIVDFVNPKLKYVADCCKNSVYIVAYRFQEDNSNICKTLDEIGISHCDTISEFKERVAKGEHVILVLQCSRGKAANIQICQKIIYYTADFSFINYKQMIHRCWRRGQTDACDVTFLVNEPIGDNHHIELKIWKALRTKQSIHDTLMSIKQPEVNENDV